MTDDDHHTDGASPDSDQPRDRASHAESGEAPGQLPRFVRTIGVLPVEATSRPTTGIRTLPAFGGVLDVGVDAESGVPPALTHLTLTDLIVRGIGDGSGARSMSRSRDGGDVSGGDTDANEGDRSRRVHEVLRGEDQTDASGDDPSRSPAESSGLDGPERLTEQRGTDTETAAETDAPLRDLRELADSPAVLGGGRSGTDDRRTPGTALRTVLSTAALPALIAGASAPRSPLASAAPDTDRSRDAAIDSSPASATGRSPRRTQLDPGRYRDPMTAPTSHQADVSTEASTTSDDQAPRESDPGSRVAPSTSHLDSSPRNRGTADTPDVTPGAAGSAGRGTAATAGVPSTLVASPSVRAATDRETGAAGPSSGSAATSGVPGAAPGTEGAGTGRPVRLTLLQGTDGSDDAAGREEGSADHRGPRRNASESRAPGAPGRTDPADSDQESGSEAGSSARRRAGLDADSGFPSNLNLDFGRSGDVGRFVERLYWELSRIDRLERRRRGF